MPTTTPSTAADPPILFRCPTCGPTTIGRAALAASSDAAVSAVWFVHATADATKFRGTSDRPADCSVTVLRDLLRLATPTETIH
jgi:hypothetical protein